ncbi:MAG: thioredoxin [Epulopiscium sp. Nuni2H_MBin003]|nr:MAG: thioredoxin [Epulopiscium sp. Nuni2H_MBin003]
MTFQFTDDNFQQEALESDIPVVVDFYADWCGPCKAVTPIIEELATIFEGKIKIGKMNTDENRTTAKQYNIMSIPTILLIKDGEVIDTVQGAMPKVILKRKIDTLL